MIQQNELITFLISLGVMLFILLNRRRVMEIPAAPVLVFTYTLLFTGWLLTIVEGFFLPDLVNLLEHACYAASSVGAAVWCRRVFSEERGSR